MTTIPQGIDRTSVQSWFERHVAGSRPPLHFELIAGGFSNLTYRVEDIMGTKYALRRPPIGFKPQLGAHNVLREYRILAALKDSDVPVPPVLASCSDEAVTGAPFYVMQWLEGRILDRSQHVAEILPNHATRRKAAFSVVDTLAKLHRVDPDAVGLGNLGMREDYLERQIERTAKVWEKTKTRELEIIDSLQRDLIKLRPTQAYTGIVHGDFRPGNIMLAPDGQVSAVLDWELCGLGDLLVDISYLLTNWDEPEDPWPDVWMVRAPSRAGGFPTRDELLARYTEQTGFDVQHIEYYCAFCYWRIAVIAEGVKRRYETGRMSGQQVDIEALDLRVRQRAEMSRRYLDRASAAASTRLSN